MKVYQLKAELEELIRLGYSQADIRIPIPRMMVAKLGGYPTISALQTVLQGGKNQNAKHVLMRLEGMY